jgi:hypothetical protein
VASVNVLTKAPTETLATSPDAGSTDASAAAYGAEVVIGYSASAGVAAVDTEALGATTFGTVAVMPGRASAVIASGDPLAETATVFHRANAGCAIAGCLVFDVTKEGTPYYRRIDIQFEDRTVSCLSDTRIDPIDPEVREVFAYVVNGGS